MNCGPAVRLPRFKLRAPDGIVFFVEEAPTLAAAADIIAGRLMHLAGTETAVYQLWPASVWPVTPAYATFTAPMVADLHEVLR